MAVWKIYRPLVRVPSNSELRYISHSLTASVMHINGSGNLTLCGRELAHGVKTADKPLCLQCRKIRANS